MIGIPRSKSNEKNTYAVMGTVSSKMTNPSIIKPRHKSRGSQAYNKRSVDLKPKKDSTSLDRRVYDSQRMSVSILSSHI